MDIETQHSCTPPVNTRYTMKWYAKLLALIMVCFVSFLMSSSFMRFNEAQTDKELMTIAFSLLIFLIAIYLAIHSFTVLITFTPDSVIDKDIFSTKTLPLAIIHGRREQIIHGRGGSTHYYILEPNDNQHPEIKFSQYFAMDKQFWDWFYSLKDLDAYMKQFDKDEPFGKW